MKLTLNTLFDFQNKGIFTELNNFDVPWKNDIPANLLDLDYHTKHGDKVISKTVLALVDENGLSDANKRKLAQLIFLKNQVKWVKLWDTLDLYDKFRVLDNTDWEETIEHEHEGLDIRDLEYGKQKQTFDKGEQNNEMNQGQQSLTQGSQTNKQGSQSNSVENKTSAFNSSSYQPDNSQSQNLGQREDILGQRVDTVGAKSDTSKDGARQDITENDAHADKDTLDSYFKDKVTTTRHGNIGVTTSGQLIDDFRKLVDWTIFDKVFEDINDILVLDLFGDSCADFDDYTIEVGYQLPIASQTVLGGVKIGHNLTIEADGTLNAIAESGDVLSVNGKTGVVVLTNDDVNAPSLEEFQQIEDDTEENTLAINNLAISKQDKIETQGVENGSFYGVWNEQAGWREVFQVPAYDGQEGQVLTKGNGVRYEWKNAGAGILKVAPTMLRQGYINVGNYANTFDIVIGDQTNYEFAIFDVEELRGKKYDLSVYFDNTNTDYIINRFKGGFINTSIDPRSVTGTTTITTSQGHFIGSNKQPNNGGIGGTNIFKPTNITWDYRYNIPYADEFCNGWEGIIPTWAKWLIIYGCNVLTDTNRSHINYDLRIYN